MEFIELACPKCGGNLLQVEQSNRWACTYCGVELFLQQTPTSQSTIQKTASDLRAEIRAILMDIVLAVGEFTSLYPNWEFSQWVNLEKGQGGELGAYHGVFLKQMTRKLSFEVNEKLGSPRYQKSAQDGEALVKKLQNWQKDILDKKQATQNLRMNKVKK